MASEICGIEKIEIDGLKAKFIISTNIKLRIDKELYNKLENLLKISDIEGFNVKSGFRAMSTMGRVDIADNGSDSQQVEVISDEIWDEEKIEEVKKIIEKAIKNNQKQTLDLF